MFIRPWLETLKSRWLPAKRQTSKRLVAKPALQTQVEGLEERVVLANYSLVTVIPNQGVFLADNTTLNEAPREVTLRFSPGQTINPNSLGAISVTRAGLDGVIGNADDVSVGLGYVGAGDNPNEVIVRFASTLPDDKYQIRIQATGGGSLVGNAGDSLTPDAGQTYKSFSFELDLGAQVEAVVPQPVIRDQLFSATQLSSLTDGDIVTINAGPYSYRFEINLTGSASTGIAVDIAGGSTPTQIAAALVTAINNNASGVLSASNSGNLITVSGTSFEPVVSFTTAKIDAFSKTNLTIVGNGTQFADGDLIRVTLTNPVTSVNTVYTIELNKSPNNAVGAGSIRVDFFASDTPEILTAKITGAINSLAPSLIFGTNANNTIALSAASNLGTPAVSVVTAVPNLITQPVAALSQKTNQVVVYFNQDQLNAAIAEDPTYYRLINVGTGQILLPQSVTYQYNPQNGLSAAVLTFASSLSNAAYNLKVGVSAEPNGTLVSSADATNVGTVFTGNPFQRTNTMGDGSGNSQDAADVDIYRFSTVANGIYTLTLDSSLALDGVLEFIDSDGNVILGPQNATGADGIETLMTGVLGASTFYVRVTSNGGTGSYRLTISSTEASGAGDDNSSYSTATDLGNLGTSGIELTSQIEPQNVLMPPLPGGSDEPGHRDLPSGAFTGFSAPEVGHGIGGGTDPAAPASITEMTYSFPLTYGTNLTNQITPEQKDIIRQIFQIYSYYVGIQFREVASGGQQQIVVGDIRVNAPTLDPGAAGGISGNPIIINAIFYANDNTYGGGFTGTAFHEIGHNLGLGHSYDIPSVQGGGLSSENVLPGDNDLVHLLRLFANNSSDIDLYKFSVAQAGTLSAQTVAQRLGVDNLFNSQLTLYRQDPSGAKVIIARNDDFYSKDSGLEIALQPGTYFIGVTSTGNDNYDPTISNSGFGGTSDGTYQLKLDFKPDVAATSGLRDATGRVLDGDHDGKAGGEFNTWFEVANTIFVDKLAPAGGNGMVGSPYQTISAGLAAAGPGSIVRIVGNGGADSDASTVADNVPYAIGRDYNLAQTPLADGSTFQVPQDVTVMIDAGALIKVRGQTIDVGTSSLGTDRSEGALQVLGTPVSNVTFTSWRDDAKGSIDDGANGNVATADWGGIVFRQDSDVNSGLSGVFLNQVNHATLQYGGGQVSVDGGPLRVYNVIDLETSRPTITNNIIKNNADAAISANPDSFKADDGRIGPDIHGNTVTENSTNGLFIRIQTALGSEAESLNVIARFDDTDITHVIAQNLIINGAPAGTLSNPLSARLMIDPGTIIKLSGARIETGLGSSNLIAEGTAENPIRFTSQQDDKYGAGGSFDLKNDGFAANAQPAAGNWSGIFLQPTSTASLDNVSITYAGGSSEIAGNTDFFNPIEVWQAKLRVANSVFENNLGGAASTNRGGRGFNDNSVIYVRGAQPVIVDNVFRDNIGNVISINANSMQDVVMPDYGRSTGPIDRYSSFDDNYGPLVRMNRYENNSTNGMNVRAEELAIESIWDDTDIAHVLRGKITSSEFHTYGGVRLQSSTSGSLVVKLEGGTAGFEATGDPLEISDRVGGTVQIVGQPGFPVILTSLRDDTVSTGFLPNGFPLFDTNNDGSATTAQPGDWNSLLFDQYSNDRNVAVVNETEPGLTRGNDLNSTVGNPQSLGNLAPNENSGDENRRLGFEVHGFISPDSPGDVDVYSFTANAGTEVWIDLDQTSYGLDAMVELVNSAGQVLARSLNSQDKAMGLYPLTGSLFQTVNGAPGGVGNSDLNTLTKDTTLGGDFYTSNFHDAGFRAVLPGPSGSTNTYFVRVRSQPVAGQETAAIPVGGNGLTSGNYELQVRLRQQDEQPGSTVRYADIRYATNGVELRGLPAHSIIMGESAEQTADNNSPDGSQNLGPLLQTDRNTISVSGSLSSSSDVDYYRFTLDYSQVQVIGGASDGGKFFPTMFDIDWADGLTRPDTTIAVYNSARTLIYIGRASDLADDQPAPGQGQDLDDLSRGSLGTLDPSIGVVNLPAGVNGESEAGGINPDPPPAGLTTYYVAVFSNGMLPRALAANFGSTDSGQQLTRLEPVNSIRRVVEDHIGFTGYSSQGSVVAPVNGPLFNTNDSISLEVNIRPFTLSDVNLFVTSGGRLNVVDPFNGTTEINYGDYGQPFMQDLDMRSDGTLWGVRANGSDGRNGFLVQLNTGTGGDLQALSDGIADVDGDVNTQRFQSNNAASTAVAFRRSGVSTYDYVFYAQGNADDYPDEAMAGAASKLYRGSAASGSAAWTAGDLGATGIVTDNAFTITTQTTGLQFLGGTLWGVSAGNQLYRVSTQGSINSGGTAIGNPHNVTPATDATLTPHLVTGTILNYSALLNPGETFSGITDAPQNVENRAYADFLFILTSTGRIICVDPTAATAAASLQTVFDSNDDNVADSNYLQTSVSGGTGLAFSPIDYNLWHTTAARSSDAGHGINSTTGTIASPNVDNSRVPGSALYSAQFGTELLNSNEGTGGASMYFGLEAYGSGVGGNYFQYDSGGQLGVLSSVSQQDLTVVPAGQIGNYNVPGGTAGSLVTNSFDLEGYAPGDEPVLYFNYWLQTEGANGKTSNSMRDSARVFVSTDNGLSWQLVATNNSALSAALVEDAELPAYLSTSSNASDKINQGVQELYETSSWRQARVDLRDYVGSSEVKLRFDFSTGGRSGTVIDKNTGLRVPGTDTSDPTFLSDTGDSDGVTAGGANSPLRAQANTAEGFYVDDIIIGFAGRGEMVTNATAGDAEFINLLTNGVAALGGQPTRDPDLTSTPQLLTGGYQLEIRRGEEYGALFVPTKNLVAINPTLDINDRLTTGQTIMVGNNATVGDTVTIYDGLITRTFEFTLGGVPTTVGAIGIDISPYDPIQDKGLIAEALATQITSTFAGRNTVIAKAVGANVNSDRIDIFGAIEVTGVGTGAPIPSLPDQVESNDTLATATNSTITGGFSGSISGRGVIGDGPNGNRDVDFYSMTLAAGQRMSFDLDFTTSGSRDSILQIFNSVGTLLATSDDANGSLPENGSLESFLLYVAPSAGTYYLGVSGYDNFGYNPTVAGSGTPGSTFGYSLNINRVIGNDNESGIFANDYPISGFSSNAFAPLSSGTEGEYQITGFIGNSGQGNDDSDFYEVSMVAGQTLTVDLIVTDSSLTDDYVLGLIADGSTTPDAFVINGRLTFTATTSGTYHIGVLGDDGDPLTSPLNAGFSVPGDPLASAGNDTFAYLLDVSLRPDGYVPVIALTVDTYDRRGDDNLPRQQGQFIVENNTILHSEENGIWIDDNDRFGTVPHPGAAMNTPVTTTQALVTGLYVQNNVIAGFGQSGVEIEGDPNGSLGKPITPFVKVVNNTIVNTGNTGFGIHVTNNASPTLMNNAIVGTNTAISIDGSSSSTEVEANLFQNNTLIGRLGNNSLVVANGVLLFVDASKDNYYPAPGSPLIDSSRSVFNDRATYISVMGPLSIPPSPIIAPQFDRFGQLRVDDGSQAGPAGQPGLGQNPFQDRGALERADFDGGLVIPTVPQDNDGSAFDLDPTPTSIWIDAATPGAEFSIFTTFTLQLIDTGIGIDDSTVSATDFVLVQNGTLLVEGQDYFFTYNQNTNEAIFTSVSKFALDSRYQIVLNGAGIQDLAGNNLQNNQAQPITPTNPNIPAPFNSSLLYFTYILTNGENDVPTVAVGGTTVPLPSSVQVNEDSSVTFSAANNNAIAVSDQDAFLAADGDPTTGADGGRIKVTIEIAPSFVGNPNLVDTTIYGSFSPLSSSLTSVLDSYSFTSTQIELEGRIDDIRAALDGLKFTPTPNFPANSASTVQLLVTTDDFGKFGPALPVTTAPTYIIPIQINPVNDAPTLSVATPPGNTTSPGNITILEDAGSVPLTLTNLTAGGGENQTLTVTIVSNNPSIIPSPNVVYTGPDNAGPLIVNFAPAANQFTTGTPVRLRVTISDGVSSVFSDVFVTVTSVNDAPTLGVITPNPTPIDEDELATQTVFLTGISAGAANENQSLTFSASIISGPIIVNNFVFTSTGPTTATLTYKAIPNANGTAVVKVTVTDSNGATNTPDRTFTVQINPVNDPPTIDQIADRPLLEDAAPQTFDLTNIFPGPFGETGSILTIDVTSSNQTVVPNANIAKGTFNSGAGTLQLIITPVGNVSGPVTITVLVTDEGGRQTPMSFKMDVSPVNDIPVLGPITSPNPITEGDGQQTINLSGISVGPPDESGQTPTIIATYFSGTQNLVNNFQYSGVDGSGNATLRYTPLPEAFGTAVYSVVVNDGFANSVPQFFTITINAVNDVPTMNTITSPVAILEDAGQRQIVLTGLSGGPANEDQTLTFSAAVISGEAIVDTFEFVPVPGQPTQYTMKYRTVQDFNGTSTIEVTATDSLGAFVKRTFTVTITPVNDRPTLDEIADQSPVAEDSGEHAITLTGISVGPVHEQTETPLQTLIFTVTSDNPALIPNLASNLRIDYTSGGTGQLVYKALDNAHGTAKITVNVTDTGSPAGTLLTPIEFTVTVTPSPDAPTDIVLSNNVALEQKPAGTLVGTLSTIDPDLPNDTSTYTIVGGNGVAFFTIPTGTNELRTTQPLVYANVAGGFYTVIVETTDSTGATFQKTLNIVNSPNSNPTSISLSNDTIAEIPAGTSLPANVLVGTLTTIDPEVIDTHTYSLVGGADMASFKIVGNQLIAVGPIDFDAQGNYSIVIRSTDSHSPAGFLDQTFTIHTTPVNEAAASISTQANPISGVPNSIPENQAPGSIVGKLVAGDPDANDTATFAFVTGAGSTDNNKFSIVNGNLVANVTFNFEVKNSYTVRIKTTDTAGLTFETAVVISVTDVNESPTNINLSNSSVTENSPATTAVGTFTTVDPDTGNTFTYSLVPGTGGTDNAKFEIVNGVLQVVTPPDYEVPGHAYSIRVRSTDAGNAGLFTEKVFSITITNVNEAPTGLTMSNQTVAENKPLGTIVGTLGSDDQDSPDAFTYTLVAGDGSDDNALFAISGDKLVTNASFDFEARTTYTVRVQTRDNGGQTFQKQFTITITDAFDAPRITLSGSTGATTGRKPIVVDPSAQIEDIDTTDFNGGRLVVKIQSGEQKGDTLSILKGATFNGLTLKTVRGQTILRLGNTDLATVSGGVRAIPLTIQFGSSTSLELMQTVMQSITFRGKPFAAPRVISMQVFDDKGLASNVATRNIDVN